jgi:hypothetical protein
MPENVNVAPRSLLHQHAITQHHRSHLLFIDAMAQTDDAKRATTILTIAQLRIKQALKKEDHDARLLPVSVDVSSQFFSHLDAVLKQNTPVNIQVSDYIAITRRRSWAD